MPTPTTFNLLPICSEPDPSLRQETLELLEWPRLCQHLASFAATPLGRRACLELDPWRSRAESEVCLDQTEEAIRLDCSQPGGFLWTGSTTCCRPWNGSNEGVS